MRTISFSFVDSNGDASSSSAKARERCLSFLKVFILSRNEPTNPGTSHACLNFISTYPNSQIDGAENGMDYRPITPPASWNAASAVIESRLRSWLTQRIKKSDLVSMLRDLCKDELRVASYYMPASIVRIPRDLALLLNILSEIEALPLVPPRTYSCTSDPNPKGLLLNAVFLGKCLLISISIIHSGGGANPPGWPSSCICQE